MTDLSILIPARNEIFLARTIEDILQNIEGETEIIAVLDGEWANPGIPLHDRVNIIKYPESIGQRAATNKAASMSQAKYLMKLDPHCAFDKGFDVKMMDDMQDDWTMVPLMKNLHAFDWVCPVCGNRRYQGPAPTICEPCGKFVEHEMDVVWRAKDSPNSTAYRFTRELQFKYFPELKKRQEGDLVETMSLQGSCFMATRDKYWELGLCDESWGSWGQQGTEVALKTWLSGGRVICNKKTWYAHMFRTQPGFNWPYPAPGKSQQKARQISRDIFLNDKWDKAIHPLSWLIDKFAPIPDWENDPTKGIIYYTCNTHEPLIESACRKQLRKAAGEIPIVAVSLNQPIDFGDVNIQIDGQRSPEMMHRQILEGLEACDAEVVFLCESDVLYHPDHFAFTPPRKDGYFYNTNVWRLRYKDGHALYMDDCKQVSGMCAYHETLLHQYEKRMDVLAEDGKFSRRTGFEPGTHQRDPRVYDFKAEGWKSNNPNIDIRHDETLTSNRWKKEQYRNQRYTQGWTEADEVPGWGMTKNRFDEFIGEI